ncbi:MAG: U32 family peptidase [Spirochaetaceae bacterium]|jgi:putative protease|nr:U32 family peptidase [Spirochaetaceae bacterium]
MVELLAPAGTPEALDAAVAEGADAVYLGLKSFNARLRSSNFTWKEADIASRQLRKRGKKLYVTVNTVCEEGETEDLYKVLYFLDAIGVDGVILQDFAVLRMVQEFFPRLKLHGSTQMNIASARGVNYLSRSGVRRVVLARELSLEEIRSIKERTSSEIEVFVHGALCVSESGLCLFSSFLGGKSANRGMCAQACRRLYTVADEEGGGRSGYFFSPNDYELIEKVPALIDCGVDAFKIEGRMKSAEYVGAVTAAYRRVIDSCMDSRPEGRRDALESARRALAGDFGRAKTSFWYDFSPAPSPDGAGAALGTEAVAQGTLNPDQAGGTGIYLGKLAKTRADGFGAFSGRGYEAAEGDSIRLHKKDDTLRRSHKIKTVETDRKGLRWVDIPEGFSPGDEVYLIQTKSAQRYPRIIPQGAHGSKPGKPPAEFPALDLTVPDRAELAPFPKGVYMLVSTPRDMAAVQGEGPVRVILEVNSESRAHLLAGAPLPFPKKQVFLWLEPFCPQSGEPALGALVDKLLAEGFTNWVANNPAHLSLLRGKGAFVIAGPYLYAFNRWAASWLENQDVRAFIPPLENSRRNLEATFDRNVRPRALVPLFAYPPLFRMRFRLPESYDFTHFSDKKDMVFKTLVTPDGSFVLPEEPFSAVDAAEALTTAGFSRFLFDFSKIAIKKKQVKQILGAFRKGEVLPGTRRFNWSGPR